MGLKWSDLFAIGNIVHPTVRRPGLRTPRRLSDFGFREDSSIEKSGTEGHWKLVPQYALKNIDRIGRKVRDTVDSCSVPFLLVPGGMFVPNTSINYLVSELTKLKKDYLAEVDILIRNYDILLEEQCPAIKAYVERINPEMDAEVTIRRVRSYAPPADWLAKRFDISWSVFAFQAPVSKAVAQIVEKEEKSVRDAIVKLVEKTKEQIIEEIDRLTKLIDTERSTSFSQKSIDVGLEACRRFKIKNVFQDEFINKSIDRLRSLLKTMEYEREEGITERTKSGFEDLKREVAESDTEKQTDKAVKKLGDKKFTERDI